MKPITIIFLLAIFSFTHARAQEYDLEVAQRGERLWEELAPLESQTPQIGAYSSPLNSAISFLFSPLRYENRGLPYHLKGLLINGVTLNSLSNSSIPYSAVGTIYRLPGSNYINLTQNILTSHPSYNITSSQSYQIDPLLSYNNGYLYSSTSSKTYSYKLSAGYNLKKDNWAISLEGNRSWGRSRQIDGVWADNIGLNLSATTLLGKDHNTAKLTLTALLNSCLRALPRSITEEAAQLTDNYLYNPAWGFAGGEQQSVNVRGGFEPIFIANYSQKLDSTFTLELSAASRFGRSHYSALNWQSAPNPLPDYYRYMPSFQSSEASKELISELWQSDQSYSQIDFDELSLMNQTSGDGRANYIIENRVNEPLFLWAGGRLIGEDFSVGLNSSYQSERFYKELTSLLGAKYWLDVDSFVEQDEDIKELTQNNLLEPNREIYPGDEFGYNYSIKNLRVSGDAAFEHSWQGFTLKVAGEVKLTTHQRVGHYEKENFSKERSLGASENLLVMDYSARVEGLYRLGGLFELSATVGYNSLGNSTDELFLNSQYCNIATPNISNSQFLTAELGAIYRGNSVRMGLNLYSYALSGGNEMISLYDDLENCYINYHLTGIAASYSGLEFWGEFLLFEPLWLNVVGTLQSNRYSKNPYGIGYKDSTGEVVVDQEELHYQNLHTGGSPEKVLSIGLDYRPYGWNIRLNGTLFEEGYERLSPIRYTNRALDRANKESGGAVAMQDQDGGERLGLMVDIFGGYTFRFNHNRSLGLYAGVNNLLNTRDIRISSYQSSRFIEDGWNLTPQASKGYYALPMNFFVSATFRF